MKILVFIADGFEEVEALTVVDYLRRLNIIVDMVSISENHQVSGSHYIEVTTNKLISEIKHKDYDGLVIPGGMPGATNLKDNSQVIELVQKMHADNKMIAAICAGPIVLEKAGIIEGKNITSYPNFEQKLKNSNYKKDKTVRDGNIITARGPYFAVDFTFEIVDYLLGKDKLLQLKKDILYNL